MNSAKKTKKSIEKELIKDYENLVSKKKEYPQDFWTKKSGKTRKKIILRYLIEDKLKIPIKEIPQKIDRGFFKKNYISNLLKAHENSIFQVIDSVYPGLFQEWDIKDYWKTKTGIKQIKTMAKEIIEKKLKIDPKEIPKNYDKIKKNREIQNFLEFFENSFFKLIEHVYPSKFTPWHFFDYKRENRQKNLQKAKETVIWLVEDKLKISKDEIPKKINQKLFVRFGLSDLLANLFHGSVYRAIENAYSEKFGHWHFTDEHAWEGVEGKKIAKKVIRHIVEKHLKISIDEIPKKLTHKTFTRYNLGPLLHQFGGSLYEAVDVAYPKKFQRWHFSDKVWDDKKNLNKNAKEAIKWLKKKLNIKLDEIPNKITPKVLRKNNLSKLLDKFDDSIFELIDNAYPGRFLEWQFDQSTLWSSKNALKKSKEATKWLVEEKLKITLKKIPKKITQDSFIKNNLGGMLIDLFDGSLFLCIDNAYPGAFKKEDFDHKKELVKRDLAKKATRWLLDEHLKMPLHEQIHKITGRLFYRYGLGGMLKKYFRNSIYLAIINAYPGKIHL